MAFTGTGKKDKPTQPGVEEGLEAAKVSQDSIEFLEPKKDAKKDSYNDAYKEEITRKNAYQYTLKTLNALKIVSPIIAALMERPGVDAKNETLSENFKILIAETSSVSESICAKLNIDPTKERNFWIRNVLEKSVAEIIYHQWSKHGQVNIKPINDLIDEVVKFGETTAEKAQYDEVSEQSLVKLAGIRCMLPVLKEAQENSLYRNIEKDIEEIMMKLFAESKKAVIKLADDYAQEKDRAKLFYMLMQEAGTLYASSWRAEANRINQIMQNYPPEKLQSVLDKYKTTGGLPLTKINNDFDKYFDKMMTITERLVASQKGNIGNRLQNKK